MVPAPLCPLDFALRYLPHYFRYRPNAMHLQSFASYAGQHTTGVHDRRGSRLAIAAPRGAAKSTVHSLLFPLMDIAYGREPYTIIVSATINQANARIASITRELIENERLHKDFFDGKSPIKRGNRRMVEVNGARIEAFGVLAEMRGISNGTYRPTRIILDDVEASFNALRSDARTRLAAWYNEVIENLGDRYTHITIIGTILHEHSLLSNLLTRPGFEGHQYASIIHWSKQPDLWKMWQHLYIDDRHGANPGEADRFLAEHTDAMMDGVEVLWPDKEDYVDLQKQLITMGRAAFFKEKQNEPFRAEGRVFDTATWVRYIAPDRKVQLLPAADGERTPLWPGTEPPRLPGLDDLTMYGYLDPALGKSTSRDGDFAAIVTIGHDHRQNVFYVMNVTMKKVTPSRQVEEVYTLHQHYHYTAFGFESNGFQEMLRNEFRLEERRRRDKGEAWVLPLKAIVNTGNKHARICALEPLIVSGTIVFQQNLCEEFFIQADSYDGVRGHDDGLDALAGCIQMIRKHFTRPDLPTRIPAITRRPAF